MRKYLTILFLLIISVANGGKFYWVGDGGNWSDYGTHWATTDGGSTFHANAPTSSDSCYFTAASLSSNGQTVTIDATANCADLDISGIDQTMTLSSSANSIYIYGSMTLPASNLTWTFTSTAYVYFKSTATGKTITMGSTSNRALNKVVFDGSGGEWTLQDNFTSSLASILLYNGSLVTNSKTIVIAYFDIYTGTKSLTLGSSTLTMNDWGANSMVTTGLTFDCGTSTINIQANFLFGNGLTYYDVSFNRTNDNVYLRGSSTFNNLTRVGSTGGGGYTNILIYGDQTINGALTISGGSSTQYRQLVLSSTLGTQRTLTCNGTISITDCDFRDIKIAGTVAPVDYSSSEIGNCGGNSGITFRTGEKRYYHVGTGNYHDAKWYSATNGGGSAKGMPLPQDTAMFDASSFDGTATLTIANFRIGSLDMSGVDDAVTLSFNYTVPESYGGYILGNNISPSFSPIVSFMCRSAYDVSTYNKSHLYLTFYGSGRATFLSNTTLTAAAGLTLKASLLSPLVDLNDFDLTTTSVNLENALTGKLYAGNGTITLTASGAYSFLCYAGGTSVFDAEGSTVKFTNCNSIYAVSPSAPTFNNLWIQGTLCGFGTGFTCNDLKIDAGKSVKFTAGTTVNLSSLTAIGTLGNLITITSITSSAHTLSCTTGKICCDYLNLSYSTATGGATWKAGSHSTNGGNNTGWSFTDCSTPNPFFWAEF